MFSKLLEYLRKALKEMVDSPSSDVISKQDIDTISSVMQDAIDKWKKMYMDQAEWLSDDDGVYSMNLSSSICQELTMYVLNEMESHIVTPGTLEDSNSHDLSKDNTISEPKTRAEYLDNLYHKHLLDKLYEVLEKAMALGGVVIKPYISNGNIYFDFCYQGEFYPIAFDDDGNITDIAFLDSFVVGDKKYSKVERQMFDCNTHSITVTNKAYVCKNNPNSDVMELGKEIPLTMIEKWQNISEEATVGNVERPLFGYYKVPTANNVDIDSPLGVSVFSRAANIIKRADMQFSRLDWEYEGGQIAIDVDPTAIVSEESYYGNTLKMDNVKNRIYRKIDLGSDETYKAFAPGLRDANYLNGLNMYLSRIEDLTGIARGTFSEAEAVAMTATEVKLLKQRTFATVTKHQTALQEALECAIYAANALASLYKKELGVPNGDYVTNTEWSDSILVDTYAELEQRLNLVDKKILSKAEVRSWYTGEDDKTAEEAIAKISESEKSELMNDLFSQVPTNTLEQSGQEDEDNEDEEE